MKHTEHSRRRTCSGSYANERAEETLPELFETDEVGEDVVLIFRWGIISRSQHEII